MAMIDHSLAEPAAAWLLAFSVAVFVSKRSRRALDRMARMPADYFVRERTLQGRTHTRSCAPCCKRPRTRSACVVLAGVAMLVLPGQGILTMLIGLSLVEFPGKRKVELRILGLPGVRKVVSALRRRAGRPPLDLER